MANYFTCPIVSVACAISILCLALAESANSPFIVAHKRVSRTKVNSDLERLSVSVDIYNTGSEPAYDVALYDDNWAEEVFDTVIGNTSKTWEKLDAGSLVSHSFELESKVKTVYYGTPALITYRVPTKSKLQEAYSTPILPLRILSESAAENKFQIAKMLLAKYGSLISVVLIVAIFANIFTSPTKASAGKKKKH
ncbi:translocon-associated protein subunit beta-like [Salvia splendens]|uniref:translocon-associated protein subunit beta-like n=1 Tax=Salvia splendens TaxID=180675 RepID=UPI001C27C9EF|nr:translocon-associated protein subunit beta-like [Salvia splendens]